MRELIIIAFCVGIAAMCAIILVSLYLFELFVNFPAPDPITYETGLYVESENIQPARGDLQ